MRSATVCLLLIVITLIKLSTLSFMERLSHIILQKFQNNFSSSQELFRQLSCSFLDLKCQFPISRVLSRCCCFFQLPTVPQKGWHWVSTQRVQILTKSLLKTLWVFQMLFPPKKNPNLLLEVLSHHKVLFLKFCAIDTQNKFYFQPK